MNKVNLSVIVPVYGVEQYIEKCARSLMEQTLREGIEFLFINDCTPDNSVQVIRNVLKDYPERVSQVRIIDMPQNSGLSIVRRVGIEQAMGTYVIACDSDDWTEPDMYEKMLKTALQTDTDIVTCDFFSEYSDRQEIDVIGKHSCREALMLGPVKHWWSVWVRMVRRSLIVENGLYPIPGVSCWEDVYVLMRVYYLTNRIEHIDKPLYHYNRTNVGSILHKNVEKTISEIKRTVAELQVFASDKEQWLIDRFALLDAETDEFAEMLRDVARKGEIPK